MIAHDKQPISKIQWLSVDEIVANAYNPNVVIAPEMALLKFSLLSTGWIQPILVGYEEDTKIYTIIDGFHRATLAKTDPKVRAMTDGLVPCAVLALDKAQRMMLTVRINRAKGSHVAYAMHELVKELIGDLGITMKEVCEGIGATPHEVQTLLAENLFEKFDVRNNPYNTAWSPL